MRFSTHGPFHITSFLPQIRCSPENFLTLSGWGVDVQADDLTLLRLFLKARYLQSKHIELAVNAVCNSLENSLTAAECREDTVHVKQRFANLYF